MTDSTKQQEREIPAAASFSLTASLLSWIESEAQRRGVKKSTVVRDILDSARAESEQAGELMQVAS